MLAAPLHYVEMVFAFLATLAFLLYLRGFLGSIGNIFKLNAHEEHLEHAQVRAVHGILFLLMLFAVWEMVRTIAIWVGLLTGSPVLGLYIFCLILLVYAYRFVAKNLFSGGGGGGH